MSEECDIVRNREGFLVNTCTGEVLGFDNYSTDDFSKLAYYGRVGTPKRSRTGKTRKGVKDIDKIVLDYLLSVMDEDEKDKFYRVLDEVEKHRKPDPALLLAIYEYVMTKEGKTISRDYIKFMKMKGKGVGKYAIRQRKRFLMKVLREDPVLEFINTLEPDVRDEALELYDILKKKGLIYGKAETRKRILMEYLNDNNKKKEVLEKEMIEVLIRWDLDYVITV
jgi:hypothetical protein